MHSLAYELRDLRRCAHRCCADTYMGYAGIDEPRERAVLIAYLEAANGSRALCP